MKQNVHWTNRIYSFKYKQYYMWKQISSTLDISIIVPQKKDKNDKCFHPSFKKLCCILYVLWDTLFKRLNLRNLFPWQLSDVFSIWKQRLWIICYWQCSTENFLYLIKKDKLVHLFLIFNKHLCGKCNVGDSSVSL